MTEGRNIVEKTVTQPSKWCSGSKPLLAPYLDELGER